MPKPLSKYAPKSSYVMAMSGTLGNDFLPVFKDNPKFGLYAIELIAYWSHVDSARYELFKSLSGGEKSDAYELYVNQLSGPAKTNMLITMVNKKCTEKEQKLFSAINGISKSAEKTRNKFAHWQYGFIVGKQDVILLLDPRTNPKDGDRRKHIYVYEIIELHQFILHLSKIRSFFTFFSAAINDTNTEEQRLQLYDQLCKEPEILEKLNRQA